MFTKRSVIGMLLVVNLMLLAALFSTVRPARSAMAQGPGRGGGFIAATAKPQGQLYEALFLLDVPNRKLYAVFPAASPPNRLMPVAPRDLKEDFQRN